MRGNWGGTQGQPTLSLTEHSRYFVLHSEKHGCSLKAENQGSDLFITWVPGWMMEPSWGHAKRSRQKRMVTGTKIITMEMGMRGF